MARFRWSVGSALGALRWTMTGVCAAQFRGIMGVAPSSRVRANSYP
jgi:hypothetical protein